MSPFDASEPPPATSLSALADMPRWVAWQTEGRGQQGKPTKVPYAPDGRKAKADDPRTWGTREAAELQASKLPRPFTVGGVGIELGDCAGLALGGIDLDSCRSVETGALEVWASNVIARFASYAEVSPSGTGVKIFFTFQGSDLPRIRAAMGTEHGKQFKRRTGLDHPPAIELYLGNRYFAVTGQHLESTPLDLMPVATDTLLWLVQAEGPSFAGVGPKASAPRDHERPSERRTSSGDSSRSALAFSIACQVKRDGGSFDDFVAAVSADPRTADWVEEKGRADSGRELTRCWRRAGQSVEDEVLLTEHGVALAFTKEYRGKLLYDHDSGTWYEWTGTHWAADRKHIAFTFARSLVAKANKDAEFKTQAITGKAAFAGGVEKFAQRDPAHAVTTDYWDQDPYLLATPGGVVELRSGELLRAMPDQMMTRITAVAPAEPGTEAPLWRAFLLQTTQNDSPLMGFLQFWAGYCLTGDTKQHELFFGYGPGGNGKGVFINTISRIMGTYAVVAAMDTITAAQSDKHPTDLAMLRGARMVCASETEEGRAWAESRIKQMTGGDPITARFMRQDFFTYQPQFKLTIIGNHKPILRNVDEAARRRFNIVPFLHKPEVKDPDLEAKLRAEWPAILRWMIDGCLAWQDRGLPKPAAILNATADYFEGQDLVGQWIADHCDTDRKSLSETTEALFKAWTAYAIATGEKPGTARWFSQTLQRHGFNSEKNTPKHHGKRGFSGIALKLDDTSGQWQNRSE
jgi:putative DNA primase/helicase